MTFTISVESKLSSRSIRFSGILENITRFPGIPENLKKSQISRKKILTIFHGVSQKIDHIQENPEILGFSDFFFGIKIPKSRDSGYCKNPIP